MIFTSNFGHSLISMTVAANPSTMFINVTWKQMLQFIGVFLVNEDPVA